VERRLIGEVAYWRGGFSGEEDYWRGRLRRDY
jgi:hypothetical protein